MSLLRFNASCRKAQLRRSFNQYKTRSDSCSLHPADYPRSISSQEDKDRGWNCWDWTRSNSRSQKTFLPPTVHPPGRCQSVYSTQWRRSYHRKRNSFKKFNNFISVLNSLHSTFEAQKSSDGIWSRENYWFTVCWIWSSSRCQSTCERFR